MTQLLAFDTATTLCSAALFADGLLIAKAEADGQNAHAAALAPLCRKLLAENHVSFSQLSAIAVGSGPGSYTGLRIGASFAKGLCAALQKPLIAINSLQILAAAVQHQFPDNEHPIIAMIDARRDEVFSAIFDARLQEIRATKAEILCPGLYDDMPGKGVIAVGDGAGKAEQLLRDGRILYPPGFDFPRAQFMGALAFEKFQKGDFENLAAFTPFYLKDFIAGRSKFSL